MAKKSVRKAARRDALVTKVLASIDRVASVKHLAHESLCGSLSTLMTFGRNCETYMHVEDVDALRAAVEAFVKAAPIELLEEMIERAEREITWANWWDERGYAESIGAVPERGYDYETMRAGVAQ